MRRLDEIRKEAVAEVIRVEGGYVHDPSDSGGETNYGITLKVARGEGYNGRMRDMPRHFAERVYLKSYWDKNRLDQVAERSEKIALEIFDTAVNQGNSRAAGFFQRALNALNMEEQSYRDNKVDGVIGSRTLEAFNAFMDLRGDKGELVMLRILNCLQGAFYVSLVESRSKDEKFIFGWMLSRVKI